MPSIHLTIKHRQRIEVFLDLGLSARGISKQIGFSHTAINNELDRNGTPGTNKTSRVNRPAILDQDMRALRGKGLSSDKYEATRRHAERKRQYVKRSFTYYAQEAQLRCDERCKRAKTGSRKIADGSEEAQKVTALLRAKWSPEIIGIRSKVQKDTGLLAGKTAIYAWIKRSNNRAELEKLLRRKGKKLIYGKTSFNQTNGKRSIHDRPEVISDLGRLGDLEGDTIVGKDKKDRLLTHVDRLAGVVSISRVLGYDSHKVHKQTTKDVNRVFGNDTHSSTYDNGNEFTAWKLTEQALDINIYFADPYRSSQRGRNENINGLIRQYLPKGTDLKKVSEKRIREIENELNNRPRKRYNGLTPFEFRDTLVETC